MNEPTKLSDPSEQVLEWLIKGESDRDIKAELAEICPGQDPRELIRDAANHFAMVSECDMDVITGWAIESYRSIYKETVATGDFANALKAVKELVSLAKSHDVYREKHEAETEGEEEEQRIEKTA